ncbi:Hypothetical protein A7982_08657 [Minicystis rosea]|nr:Hypothetical protein A7982_08657 [Minicystis rosea]
MHGAPRITGAQRFPRGPAKVAGLFQLERGARVIDRAPHPIDQGCGAGADMAAA